MDHNKIVIQWREFEIPEVYYRDSEIDLDLDFIWSIIGSRRSGKTYFCFKIMKALLSNGILKENILYVNFEDEKLLGANADDLTHLLDAYYTLFTPDKNQKIYLFLDEIQNVVNWDVWVRRIFDSEKNIKMVLTGLSSKLLSKEISTKLRGRVLSREIFPLSFREFLNWNDVKYDVKTLVHSKQRHQVNKSFHNFLMSGGYPAIVLAKSHESEILQRYYDSMIFKDIIERYNVKDTKKLKTLGKFLFESVSNEITYNKLANKLKSVGFTISKNTVIEYISHFEDAYLFFQNLRYEYSLTKQLGAIKKIYCIDNGLLNAVSFKFSDDIGKLIENVVYMELRRRGYEIYYHRGTNECDFIIKEKNKVTDAIQVTHVLSDENEARETKGLLEVVNRYNLKSGRIITNQETESTKEIDGKKIIITPIWLWLLY